MHTSLTRQQFLDRVLNVSEVDAIAYLLTTWYWRQGHHSATNFSVEAIFWGFPKSQGESLRQRLIEIASSSDASSTTISLSDPNKLSVIKDSIQIQIMQPPGRVAAHLSAILVEPTVEHLWCELQLKIGNAGNLNTLVLCGVIRAGALLLKAIWSKGGGEFDESIFAHQAWPQERNLLSELDEYLIHGKVNNPTWVDAHLFPGPVLQKMYRVLTWFLWTRRSVNEFLIRAAAAVTAGVICIVGMRLTHGIWAQFWTFSLVAAIAALCFILWSKVSLISLARRRMQMTFREMCEKPITFQAIDISSQLEWLNDPAVRKMSDDIVAIGGVHFMDIRSEPWKPQNSFGRVFLFPEYETVFAVLFLTETGQFKIYPAKPSFLVWTRLTDVHMLSSANGGVGWRKPLPTPGISRVFANVSDPAVMLARHLDTLIEIEAKGHRRIALQPDQIIPHMEKDQLAWQKAIAEVGYCSWGDAYRMVFEIVLPHYK